MHPDEVRVWSMVTHEVPEWTLRRLSQVLAPWERSRAERHLDALDRRDYLCAHVLRRSLLSHCFHRPASDWVFETDSFGKPTVLNREPCGRVECNLSHTRGVVAAIVARDRVVGIDVERQDRPLDIDIAALICSPAEAAALHAAPRSRQREKLLQLWVRKEALTKAVGRGLSMALPLIELDDDGFTVSGRSVPGMEQPADWQVHRLAMVPSALLAAAVYGQGQRLCIRHTQIGWRRLCELCGIAAQG